MKINFGDKVKFNGDVSIYEERFQKFLLGHGYVQKHFLQDEYVNCVWVEWHSNDGATFECWTHIKNLEVDET